MKVLSPEHVVPGHGPPTTTKLFDDGEKYYALLEVIQFVRSFFDQWSALSEFDLISALAIQYADNVEYNGVRKTVHDLLLEEQQSLKRWPSQKYELRYENMTTNCSEKMLECMVTGIVDWAVKSPQRSASAVGSSRFSLYLGKVSPERFVIMRKTVAVLTNQASGR